MSTAPALELKWLDPSELEPNGRNWRQHPPAQSAALVASLDAAGWAGAALFNKTTGRLIDGHLRQKQARERGELLPVLVGEWTEAQERMILATFDPIAAMAQADETALECLIAELRADVRGGRLDYDEGQLDALLRDLNRSAAPKSGLLSGADPDAVPEQAPERCRAGDLWGLGEHRLLCRDSTKGEDVGRLLEGTLPALVWSDPPFGIGYTGHGESKDGRANKFEPIAGDGVPSGEWLPLWRPSADGAIYLKTTWAVLSEWERFLEGACRVKSHIVWDKCSHVAGDVVGGYATRSEIILFGVCGKHVTREFDADVWTIPRATTGAPEQRTGHPYESPVALPARAIKNSTDAGDVVGDPFLGSGTTLIAAESLGRRCFGMEIESAYCDVSLARWEQATGKEAVLLERA